LKPHVRRGILPKMLEEIIDTRLMVKRSMKLYNQVSKKNPGLNFINVLLARFSYQIVAPKFTKRAYNVDEIESSFKFILPHLSESYLEFSMLARVSKLVFLNSCKMGRGFILLGRQNLCFSTMHMRV